MRAREDGSFGISCAKYMRAAAAPPWGVQGRAGPLRPARPSSGSRAALFSGRRGSRHSLSAVGGMQVEDPEQDDLDNEERHNEREQPELWVSGSALLQVPPAIGRPHEVEVVELGLHRGRGGIATPRVALHRVKNDLLQDGRDRGVDLSGRGGIPDSARIYDGVDR